MDGRASDNYLARPFPPLDRRCCRWALAGRAIRGRSSVAAPLMGPANSESAQLLHMVDSIAEHRTNGGRAQ
jgi:hypothetical protein